MESTTADLEYAIIKATENIRKAEGLRLTNLAQQIRRERKAMLARLESM